MDALFQPLVAATGASPDQLKLIFCLLVSYPLGSVFVRVPSPALKHAFNIAVTLFYLLAMLNLANGALQLLASSLATYFIAANVKTSSMPWIVFVVVMGHLTVNHIIRALFEFSYETVEITGPQMVLTMKLTTYAWNVFDGRRPIDELDKWQKEKRIAQTPSLLSFLGYVCYFPGILVGPYLEFADYMSLVEGTVFKSVKAEDMKNSGLVPKGRKRVAYRKLITGLAFLGTFVVFGGSYNYGNATKDWFTEYNILYRIAIFQFYGFIERTKYYAIWTLTEGAAIITGLGFTGYGPSGETRWKGAANVQILSIEVPPNLKVLLDSWNMKTNVWLRECVYKRVTPKGKKPGFRSSMITFATSAFWHGISGGYYLAFTMGGFVQTIGRLCRSNIRPLFLPATYVATRDAPPPPQTTAKIAYDVIGTVCTVLLLNYMAAPFMLLSLKDSFLGWANLQYYGIVMTVAAFAFFYGPGTSILKKMQAQRVKKAGGVPVQANGVVKTPGPQVQTLPPLDVAAQRFEKKVA
ncbi:lysophospholipid acyltransferase [Steccherinum ochraceum]|uniref:Lysophospholipid acyltransferase n=1 Tax=Steccherinum ochraceum TaxID=92696 RepID=A0A4R0RVN4_9APHY|nr:lysophospholipid acyltransferase [Steccherinum ochraceum]